MSVSEEFKRLKRWVEECPVEATMRIQELEQREQDLKDRLQEQGGKLAKTKHWLKVEKHKRKDAEWQAMVHKGAHSDIYTAHFELRERLKREGKI